MINIAYKEDIYTTDSVYRTKNHLIYATSCVYQYVRRNCPRHAPSKWLFSGQNSKFKASIIKLLSLKFSKRFSFQVVAIGIVKACFQTIASLQRLGEFQRKKGESQIHFIDFNHSSNYLFPPLIKFCPAD
jgi:hypothetical protein